MRMHVVNLYHDLKSLKKEVFEIKESLSNNAHGTPATRNINANNEELETIKEEIIEIKQFIMDFISTNKTVKTNQNPEESFISVPEDQTQNMPINPYAPPFYLRPLSPIVVQKTQVSKMKKSPVKNFTSSSPSKFMQNNYAHALKSKPLNKKKNEENEIKNSAESKSNIQDRRNIGKNFRMDDDGFITKVKKTRIVGSKQPEGGSIIKGASRTKVLYVGRLEKKTTLKDMEQHIKQETGVEILKCYKLNCSIQNSSSFKVIIKAHEINKVLSAQVWPEGTVVREYIYNKSGDNNNSLNSQ